MLQPYGFLLEEKLCTILPMVDYFGINCDIDHPSPSVLVELHLLSSPPPPKPYEIV